MNSPYNSFELDGITYVCFDSGETTYKVVDTNKIVLVGDNERITDKLEVLWDMSQTRPFMKQFSSHLFFFIEVEFSKIEELTKTKITNVEKMLASMTIGPLVEGKALHRTILGFLQNNETETVQGVINFLKPI